MPGKRSHALKRPQLIWSDVKAPWILILLEIPRSKRPQIAFILDSRRLVLSSFLCILSLPTRKGWASWAAAARALRVGGGYPGAIAVVRPPPHALRTPPSRTFNSPRAWEAPSHARLVRQSPVPRSPSGLRAPRPVTPRVSHRPPPPAIARGVSSAAPRALRSRTALRRAARPGAPAHSRGRQRRRLHCGSSRASERRHRPPPPAPFQPRTPALSARPVAFHQPRGGAALLTARHHLRRRPPRPWPVGPARSCAWRDSRAPPCAGRRRRRRRLRRRRRRDGRARCSATSGFSQPAPTP